MHLYGLPSAPANARRKLVKVLNEGGYHHTHSDGALFVKKENNELKFLSSIHVDDSLCAGKSDDIKKALDYMSKHYTLKVIHEPKMIVEYSSVDAGSTDG